VHRLDAGGRVVDLQSQVFDDGGKLAAERAVELSQRSDGALAPGQQFRQDVRGSAAAPIG